MTAPVLEVRGLSVAYRHRRKDTAAVDDVTFDVPRGATVGLVGESGSGKSTIARAVLGLAPIASGEIRFDGQDVTRLDFEGRRRLYRQAQLVFQDPYSSLNPSRTIGRTLTEPLQAYEGGREGERQAKVREMLERVQLPAGTAERYPRELSGGQRQRVAIARALMLSPRLVILDEPLSALDLSAQAQILNLLRELQDTGGLSYLFISHDLEVVRYLCDHVVVLYQGRVLETGPGDRLADQPAHPYTDMLHRASPVPDPRTQQQRRANTTAQRRRPAPEHTGAEQCNYAPRCTFATDVCWTRRPSPQPVDDGHGEAACHRYPVWQAEVPTPADAASPDEPAPEASAPPLAPVGTGPDRALPGQEN